MLAEEIDLNLLSVFIEQLKSADAVTVDDGPLLNSWQCDIEGEVADMEPEDSLAMFSWTDEKGYGCESLFTASAFSNANQPEMPDTGIWKLTDDEGSRCAVSMFRVIPLRDVPCASREHAT